jgi:replicative DNA helicase
MPHDVTAERMILGALLLGFTDIQAAVFGLLKRDHFFDVKHAEIWTAITVVVRAGGAIDTGRVRGQLDVSQRLQAAGGDEYLNSLTNTIPTLENVELSAQRVVSLSLLRTVMTNASLYIARSQHGIDDVEARLDEFEALALQCSSNRGDTGKVIAIGDAVGAAYNRLAEATGTSEGLLGLATGFTRFDAATSGLCRGDLIIVAGRPGMGKSAFVQCVARNVAARGGNVLLVSLEMATEQLACRFMASDTRIDLRRVRTGQLDSIEWTSLAKSSSVLSSLPIYMIDDRNISVADMTRLARRHAARHGLDLLIVDYLQLVRPSQPTANRERDIATISAGLKSLAGELQIPVIALSQLNRSVETRSDRHPMLSDLRESGAIEQDADVVVFLFREDAYEPETNAKGIAELNIAKQRNGPIGTVKIRWFAEQTRFENLPQEVSSELENR